MVARWGKANIARLARESGLDRSNFYTQQGGGDVEPATVTAVATALGANPIEAYIAAGYFTEAQFDAYRASVDSLSNEALARAVLTRMNGRSGGDDPAAGRGADGDLSSVPANGPLDVSRPPRTRGGSSARSDTNGSVRRIS